MLMDAGCEVLNGRMKLLGTGFVHPEKCYRHLHNAVRLFHVNYELFSQPPKIKNAGEKCSVFIKWKEDNRPKLLTYFIVSQKN